MPSLSVFVYSGELASLGGGELSLMPAPGPPWVSAINPLLPKSLYKAIRNKHVADRVDPNPIAGICSDYGAIHATGKLDFYILQGYRWVDQGPIKELYRTGLDSLIKAQPSIRSAGFDSLHFYVPQEDTASIRWILEDIGEIMDNEIAEFPDMRTKEASGDVVGVWLGDQVPMSVEELATILYSALPQRPEELLVEAHTPAGGRVCSALHAIRMPYTAVVPTGSKPNIFTKSAKSVVCGVIAATIITSCDKLIPIGGNPPTVLNIIPSLLG